jgi:DNA-binding transcriptional LysR family regulator
MNLAQLRALRAVAHRRSVTAAAGELGVTQSAVSHALASLEAELGLRLVVRSRSGCRLTEAGRRLLPGVTGALDLLEAVARTAGCLAAGDPTTDPTADQDPRNALPDPVIPEVIPHSVTNS